MSVNDAIDRANSLLPGIPTESGTDPRWQAIIAVAEYVEDEPEEVWSFAVRWGSHEQEDLREAIATCLLEHLLEYHFELIFPRVAIEVERNRVFRDTFCRCWKFGQSEMPGNSERFDKLLIRCDDAAM